MMKPSPPVGVRRAACPCGEPNPPEAGPCTREHPCGYAEMRTDLWDHFDDTFDEPYDPGDPWWKKLRALIMMPIDAVISWLNGPRVR